MILPTSICVRWDWKSSSRGATGNAGYSSQTKGKKMSRRKYPPGWNEARVRRVLEFYESQSDKEAAAEITAASKRTTMEVPTSLVPLVRHLIARRESVSLASRTRLKRLRASSKSSRARH